MAADRLVRTSCAATLAIAAIGAFQSLCPALSAELADNASRPNVVIIFADDLGWGDLQCYGHAKFKTPNIDRLAKDGARLTNFYSCCPYCAPSRAGLMTGRYQFRHGLVSN